MTAATEQQLSDLAQRIGAHLREGRRECYPRDTQDDFARRVGVSRATYQKMERGDPSVSLRSYLAAAVLLDIGQQFSEGLTPPRPGLSDGPVQS